MDESELITGKLYWVREFRSNKVYLSEYQKETEYFRVGWFNLLGTDESLNLLESEVLGRVELVIPEYAKETGYE